MKETELQKAIMDYLKLMQWTVYRINVQGVPIRDKNQKFLKYRKSANAGMADLVMWKNIKGLPVTAWLEVKTKSGTMQTSQKHFRSMVEESDGFYEVCRSIDDVQRYLMEIQRRVDYLLCYDTPF